MNEPAHDKATWQTPILVDLMQIERVTEGGRNRHPATPSLKYSADTETTRLVGADEVYFSGPTS